MSHLGKIIFGLLLTAIGIGVGMVLSDPPAPDAHAEGEEEAGEAPAAIPPQTLKSMGVVVGPVVRKDFVRHRKVQAVVVDRPLNRRPLTAALGGIVTAIHVQTGQVVEAGALLLTMARDPIPRPRADLTADLLKPISEDVHEASSRLRLAVSEIEVTKAELERIRPFVEARTIPGKTAIDLRYQLARSEQEAANTRMELHTHGLTDEEIAVVEAGGPPPQTRYLWKRSLERAGLWTETSEALWESLPPSQRDLPWCIAAVGELSATGLATPALVDFVKRSAAASEHFAEIAGLLLEGAPLATVRLLLEQGALESEVEVRAPRGDAPDWDVEQIAVRPGQRVDGGDELVRLYDARTMWLRLQPLGLEIGLVSRALEDGTLLQARPLVEDSGPDLDDVRLVRMALQSEDGDRGGAAQALIRNVSLGCAPGLACRSWQLRVGLRYLVYVPVQTLPDRFVLPTDAVTSQGADRVVFLENGDTFRPQVVHVEHADDEVVVIADDGSLFDGDRVALGGAFALGLALGGRGNQTADPHAGHNHN